MSKKALIVIGIAIVVVIIIATAVFRPKHNGPTASPQLDLNAVPDQSVVTVVTKYVQAREDQNGADRATASAWTTDIKSIVTSDWFAQLQPATDNPTGTGTTSSEFTIAHSNGYIVRAAVSKCIWDREQKTPTSTEGSVYCDVVDTTVNKSTNTAIPAASLPFAWTRNGPQLPAIINVVKQNGNWLVSKDSTGQAY